MENAENEERVLVPICKDHFQKLAEGDVCSLCPSKVENQDAIFMLASLTTAEKDKIDQAIVTEIRLLRKDNQATIKRFDVLDEKLDVLHTDIHGDGDAKQGIIMRLTLLESSVAQRWQLVATVFAALLGIGGLISSFLG